MSATAAAAYAGVDLGGGAGGSARSASLASGNLTDSHVVVFGGPPAEPGANGTIVINETAVLDTADPPNALGTGAASDRQLADGRALAPPGEARVVKAAFTARNEVTITYSGGLGAPAGHAGPVYGAVTIEPAAGVPGASPAAATPKGVAGLGTATHTVKFVGAKAGAGQAGSIELNTDLVGSGTGGAPIRLARGPIQVAAAAEAAHTVAPPPPDGRPLGPVHVVIERDGFARTVNGSAAGEAARPAINVTGLLSGGTVAFPGDGNVTLAASFAEATFPPNATALSVPDGGLLVLHVSEKPAAERVAAALGYDSAAGLDVRTVVEVGDGRTDISFDTPIRILLADQAGGRAFYVNSTGGGAVSPIGTECREDGTAAVRGQLGGAGECHIDSGPDKAIHTYHLTRFGTAAQTMPPGDPPGVSSVRALERPDGAGGGGSLQAPASYSAGQAGGGAGGGAGGSLQAPASYSAGQTVAFGVRFTAPVKVDAGSGAAAAAGMPYLELRTGSAGARAAYASGSDTDTLVFEYAVRGGDMASRVSYAGTGALVLNGSAVTAAGSGAAASTALPEPGLQGSLSHSSNPPVRIAAEPGRPVLDVGILDEAGQAGGALSSAALAAAAAFNERQGREPGALLINATVYDAGATAESAAAALRAAHSLGAGPSVYVGPSTDRGLHAAMPYADENGIVLVSAGSTAPTLAVEGDRTFRLLPGDRIEADALARLAHNAGARSVHAVLENATYGPIAPGSLEEATPPPQGLFLHGFDAALAYSAAPSLSGTVSLEGAGGPRGAAEAAAEALDASVRSGRAPHAVVYLGSPEGLAALSSASAPYPALASATWLASGLSAGSSLLEGGGPAAAFAAQAGLSAVRWSTPANDLARGIDALLPPGADAGARHRAYAAHDAVLVVGAAASAAGGGRGGDTVDASAVADGLPGAAASHNGALGNIALDHAGDLWVPAVYGLWTVAQAGAGAEWEREEGELDEERACSISLTRAKIDYGPIDSGQTSRPHLQTIVNTGQMPFAQVALTATPWHVDSPGACAAGGRPSLPVGLSEIRTEQGGAFSDLAASGTMLAEGLEAGGQAPLWYRLSLAGSADLPQAQITQCATYVVRCG